MKLVSVLRILLGELRGGGGPIATARKFRFCGSFALNCVPNNSEVLPNTDGTLNFDF